MKLIDLNPRWVRAGGEGITDRDGKAVPEQRGVGMSFDCPCGCDQRAYIDFDIALDGSQNRTKAARWHREGITFNSLTLRPSIHRSHPDSCGWHGFIRNGEVTKA